jgi:hypothetical protein
MYVMGVDFRGNLKGPDSPLARVDDARDVRSTSPRKVEPMRGARLVAWAEEEWLARLHNAGLFFTRCDLLDDQFEGSVPRTARETSVEKICGENTSADTAEKLSAALSDLNKWTRKWATHTGFIHSD